MRMGMNHKVSEIRTFASVSPGVAHVVPVNATYGALLPAPHRIVAVNKPKAFTSV